MGVPRLTKVQELTKLLDDERWSNLTIFKDKNIIQIHRVGAIILKHPAGLNIGLNNAVYKKNL